MVTSALVANLMHENKLFTNERPDNHFLGNRLMVTQSTFAKIGFKQSRFSYSQVTHCIFIDCYFKKTIFDQCDFTNCKFINCTFDEVTMINCRFDYATFVGTTVEFDQFKNNLPKDRHNLRHVMCRNLAMEWLRVGNPVEYRKYYFEEKNSSEKHYWEIVKQNKYWYRGHYTSWDRIPAFGQCISSKFNKILWGYGEKIQHLLGVIFCVILFFTLLYWNMGDIYKIDGDNSLTPLTLTKSFFLSFCNFFTVSIDVKSLNSYYRWISAIQGGIGIILIGFFSAALFRTINRR